MIKPFLDLESPDSTHDDWTLVATLKGKDEAKWKTSFNSVKTYGWFRTGMSASMLFWYYSQREMNGRFNSVIDAYQFVKNFEVVKGSHLDRHFSGFIKEINDKYPGQENAMERQRLTMDLYSKAGVNPMGGCLPLLLQMPILIAMFTFLMVYMDDLASSMPSALADFHRRMILGLPQLDPVLQQVPDNLSEFYKFYDPLCANSIIASALEFITGTALEVREEVPVGTHHPMLFGRGVLLKGGQPGRIGSRAIFFRKQRNLIQLSSTILFKSWENDSMNNFM